MELRIMKSVNPYAVISAVLLWLSGCVTTQRTDLYFGMNIPGGGRVSTEQWKQFNDSVVAPRFPEGYTELDATGKWLDTDTRQTIGEHTKVLTFIGRKSKVREAVLDTVVQTYIQQYQQQAVLRLDSKPQGQFITGRPAGKR